MLGMPLRTLLYSGDANFQYVGLLLHCNGSDGSTTFTDVKGHTVTAHHATKLLLHCDGADGSTTFTDVMGHTLTPSGNVQIDTAQSKFGGASALFDGVGDYLSVAYSTDFAFESGDFTVEAWVYRAATGSRHTIAGNRPSSGTSGWGFRISEADKLFFYFTGGSTITGATSVTASAWHHVAATRSGNTVRVFLDGTEDASATFSNGTAASSALVIGAFADGTEALNGWMDEIRITKGLARYTANFTPPTEAFPDY
jgi:Concanavalin A-like lectin/glucanases superfamily